MFLTLSFVLSVSLNQGFCAQMVVEEGDQKTDYSVDFKEGAFRVVPEGEEVSLLVDVGEKALTLIQTEDRFYCRFDRDGLAHLVKAGIVLPEWFPWVYEVGPDLVEDLELKQRGGVRLPNGKQGRRLEAYSKRYDRIVADYWLDSRFSGELFFQWRQVYFELWVEEEEAARGAQKVRLGLYDRLKGLPWKMEERFRLLTRPRVLRLESWEPVEEDVWSVPEAFTERSVAQLIWEDLMRRFERWFRPK